MGSTLAAFSDPRSVAVVGASANTSKWGYWIARGALRGRARRTVHLVNAGGAAIDGVASVRSIADLNEAPELVVLSCPAAAVPAVVEQALTMGTKGFLGITSGIDMATGEPGLERRLAEQIRVAGARLVGPNCLGIYDAATDLELAWGHFTPGHIGVVSQSGQLGLEIAGLAAYAGLGVSRFVSVGNQADVTAVEVLSDLVDHELTRAVLLYLESFADGRELVAAITRLRRAGKPVVVLTVGAGQASRGAARSHTGALTSGTEVVAAACRAAGALLVDTPGQAVDLAHLLHGSPLPRGPRVAIVSDSGGQGALAADALERAGLSVPGLSARTTVQLAELLPAGAAVANPVDLAGAGERDLMTYARVVDALVASGEVDSVVLSGYFGRYGSDTPMLRDRELDVIRDLAASVATHAVPVVVHSMSADSDAVQSLRDNGIPTLLRIDAVADSLGYATQLATTMPRDLDPVVPAAGAVGPALPYPQARELLSTYGLAYPGSETVRTEDDVRDAAARLSAPYVLKAAWLAHKTEVGGVLVDLADATAAVDAYEQLRSRLGDGDYLLEEQDVRPDVVELIVGARRDPAFGPVVLVGLGGVHAELYRDVAVALAPVSVEEALQLLGSLRAAPLLHGWRGRPPVDVGSAATAVAAVSQLLATDPAVAECDVNPLRVGPTGAVAVDALVLTCATEPGKARP